MLKRMMGVGVVVVMAALGACNSDSDGSADCSSLPACCSQLTNAANKTECDEIVAEGDASSCASAQTEFESAGVCTVTTVSSSGGGTGCAGLTTCCDSLPTADQASCNVIASSNMDSLCTAELSSYVTAGSCKAATTTTTATGCAGLTTCCDSLPTADQASCNVIASSNMDSLCTAELSSYVTAGSCSGGTTGDDGDDTSTGTGCAGLMDCCSSLSGTEQTGCNDEVTAADGSDTVCTEAISVYCPGTSTGDDDGGTTGAGCTALEDCCASSSAPASCEAVVNLDNDTECTESMTLYCGSTGGGSTGSCSDLSTCCDSVSDATEQEECNEVVSAGDDEECSSTLSGFQSAGLCSN
jgi:hypothetical protein